MKIIVIGGGVIGCSTAYFLSQKHDVILFEKNHNLGYGASFANGGQLSAIHSIALDKIVNYFGSYNINFINIINYFKLLFDNLSHKHVKAIVDLAVYSRYCLNDLNNKLSLQYDFCQNGCLFLLHSKLHYLKTMQYFRLLENNGVAIKFLSKSEVINMQPSLINANIYGAIYSMQDCHGDSYQFIKQIAERFVNNNGTVYLDSPITKMNYHNDKIISIEVNGKEHVADKYVICSGSKTSDLVKDLGLNLPIFAMKGYSCNIDRNSLSINHPIIDPYNHMVYTPINNKIRAAGLFFNADDNIIKDEQVYLLKQKISMTFKDINYYVDKQSIWCGLRPQSINNVPYICSTNYDNLLINCGHGALGWTCGVGSAKMIYDIISNNNSMIDIGNYQLDRYLL